MTEKEIQDLGFTRVDDRLEDSDPTFHYYVYELAHGLELISNGSDDIGVNDEWYVEFFDTYPPIRITDVEEVKVLINVITKNKTTDITEVDTDVLIDSVFEDEDLDDQIDNA